MSWEFASGNLMRIYTPSNANPIMYSTSYIHTYVCTFGNVNLKAPKYINTNMLGKKRAQTYIYTYGRIIVE